MSILVTTYAPFIEKGNYCVPTLYHAAGIGQRTTEKAPAHMWHIFPQGRGNSRIGQYTEWQIMGTTMEKNRTE